MSATMREVICMEGEFIDVVLVNRDGTVCGATVRDANWYRARALSFVLFVIAGLMVAWSIASAAIGLE